MDKRNNWKMDPNQIKENRPWWKFESASSVALAIAAIFCIGAGAWYHFFRADVPSSDQIPILIAENGPSKIRPEDAGQTKTEHEDKLVYNRLAPDHSDLKPQEQVLNEPEQPIELDQYDIAEDDESGEAEEETFVADEEDDILEEPVVEEAKKEPPVVIEEPVQQEKPVAIAAAKRPDTQKLFSFPKSLLGDEEIKKKEEEKKVEVVKQAPTLSSGYRVQIAAMRTLIQAQNAWKKRYSKKSPLQGQEVHFKRVDLGSGKGVFHRIQVGSFASKDEARKLCHRVKSSGLDCLVVTFKG